VEARFARAKLTSARVPAISRAVVRRAARAAALGTLMSGASLSSAGLDARRRRALFRAWRRGMREMDLVLGRFADANLPTMSEAELDQFERLLDLPDAEVFAWIAGDEPTPPAFDTPLFARLRAAPSEAGET
jgi:antitoxin CptB